MTTCAVHVEKALGQTIQGIGQYEYTPCTRKATGTVRKADGTTMCVCSVHKRMALAGTIDAKGYVHPIVDRANYSRYDQTPRDLGTWSE